MERYVCQTCGGEFWREPAPGRKPRYCSSSCKERARTRRSAGTCQHCGGKCREGSASCRACREAGRTRTLHERTCPSCGTVFHSRYRTAKFCSRACANSASRKRIQLPASAQCARCGKAYRPATHNHKYCADCREFKDREKSRRRRARIWGIDAERLNEYSVFRRDGWICQICGEPVDMDLKWPDPHSASIDHVVPLSKGGSHTLENVQLTHLVCNNRKNDRDEQA